MVTAELQTAYVTHFQRKIKLSGFAVYPDGGLPQLIRISEVLLYCTARGPDRRKNKSVSIDFKLHQIPSFFKPFTYLAIYI